MIILGKLGRDEGRFNGPPAGDGATEVGRPGYHDADGTANDELPPRLGQFVDSVAPLSSEPHLHALRPEPG